MGSRYQGGWRERELSEAREKSESTVLVIIAVF